MRVVELTPETWPSLEELFGPNGAQSGRRCAWLFRSSAEMRANGSAGNKELLRSRVRSGVPAGLPAMDDGDRAARRRDLGPVLPDYAKKHGARSVDGYPVDTGGAKKGSGTVDHGALGVFTDAGFESAERRGANRALVRLT